MSQSISSPSGERGIVLLKRFHSLKIKLVMAILISGAFAGLFYYLSGLVVESVFYPYDSFILTGYINDLEMNKFEKWVHKEQICIEDVSTEEIDQWLSQKNSMIDLNIYKGEHLLYGTEYFSYFETEDGLSYGGYNYLADYDGVCIRDIKFADTDATAYLYSFSDYSFTYICNHVRTILSFLFFLSIFFGLVSKKISYIRQLENEIKVLEGGGLDQPITIKGNDELGVLAKNLDAMRQSLLENITEREAIAEANKDLVVAVAHDVRTPLTSLMLYLDMIIRAPELNQDTRTEYLEKARRKTEQIKHMTDQLFERFLMTRNQDNKESKTNDPAEEKSFSPEEKIAERPETLWNDILSMFVTDLTDHGFETDCQIEWPERKMSIDVDLATRILDNVSSNLYKYADYNGPITLEVSEVKNAENLKQLTGSYHPFLMIRISNRIRQGNDPVESTGQGLKNIHRMMEQMHGAVTEEQNGEDYTIRLYFEMSE